MTLPFTDISDSPLSSVGFPSYSEATYYLPLFRNCSQNNIHKFSPVILSQLINVSLASTWFSTKTYIRNLQNVPY